MNLKNSNALWKLKRFCRIYMELIFKFFVSVSYIFSLNVSIIFIFSA